jgi:hypothetical protein
LVDGLVAAPESRPINWFQHVAPAAHEALYSRTVDLLGLVDMAETPEELTAEHRRKLKAAFRQRAVPGLPSELDPQYKMLIDEVSRASAELWRQVLGGRADQERILWRLLYPRRRCDLDTPHAHVPGYRRLDHTDEPPPYDQQSLIDCP